MSNIQELWQNCWNKEIELRAAIEELTEATKESFIPHAPDLAWDHVSNCRVLPNRYYLLDVVNRGGTWIEVGTQTGLFAREITTRAAPKELHVVDIDYSLFRDDAFDNINKPVKHVGRSSEILSTFPDNYFDYIYIDADHSYEGFLKDINLSSQKIKFDGLILCNDYTVWSPAEVSRYGVLRGVHEFLSRGGWEICYLALHNQGYHDVALRRKK